MYILTITYRSSVFFLLFFSLYCCFQWGYRNWWVVCLKNFLLTTKTSSLDLTTKFQLSFFRNFYLANRIIFTKKDKETQKTCKKFIKRNLEFNWYIRDIKPPKYLWFKNIVKRNLARFRKDWKRLHDFNIAIYKLRSDSPYSWLGEANKKR